MQEAEAESERRAGQGGQGHLLKVQQRRQSEGQRLRRPEEAAGDLVHPQQEEAGEDDGQVGGSGGGVKQSGLDAEEAAGEEVRAAADDGAAGAGFGREGRAVLADAQAVQPQEEDDEQVR